MRALEGSERVVLRGLARGFPEGPRPYREIAERCGVSEDDVLAAVEGLLEKGVVRRMAAIAHDARLGYGGNAMVAWRVDEDDLAAAGETVAARPEISHAYARRTTESWPYNLYTMIHAKSRDESKALVEKLAGELGTTEYRMLFSVRELTKRPPAYDLVLGGDAVDRPKGTARD